MNFQNLNLVNPSFEPLKQTGAVINHDILRGFKIKKTLCAPFVRFYVLVRVTHRPWTGFENSALRFRVFAHFGAYTLVR